MTPLGFECDSKEPNLSFCPKPSYWTQIFLSTAGTAVPIFLQPCLNFWNQLFFLTKKVSDITLFYPNSFGLKVFGPKIFGTQGFLAFNFFGLKILWDLNFLVLNFWTNCFWPELWILTFSDSKLFWTQISWTWIFLDPFFLCFDYILHSDFNLNLNLHKSHQNQL